MKRKLPMILVLALTALSLGAWRHEGHGGGIEKMAKHLTAGLNLTDDQKTKLDAVVTSFKEARKQSGETRKANREAMADLVAAKDLDTAKLSALIDSQRAAMQKSRPDILAKLADFHKSLNDDQRAKLADKLKKMGRRHSEGR